MSQAEALLNQAARSGMYTASPETEPHTRRAVRP